MKNMNSTIPANLAVQAVIGELVRRARGAQRQFETWTQDQVDDAVTAVAWAACKPGHAEQLASLAVEESGLGNCADKVTKIRRKTTGTLRDLQNGKSVGVISDDPARGITEIAKPMGVVAALCPATNPEATPINKTMMILKGRNAVILSPSPKGVKTCRLAVRLMHDELRKVGAPIDLVQSLPEPVSKELTYELMRQADFVVVTGSQANVRAAYSSGTPAIGVGLGNAPVIVDGSADLEAAAAKIKDSKVFDYATSCSSENSLLIQQDVYERMVEALRRRGGVLLSASQKQQLQRVMWTNGRLSERILAKSPRLIAETAGFADRDLQDAEFFMVEESGIGPEHPFSGEKLSIVLTIYSWRDFDEALDKVHRILAYQGAGHSCGIHSRTEKHIRRLAHEAKVARVLVNQAHSVGNGGSFDNGLNFTLTMGAGTWAKNSISENLSYRHFLNITRLVRVIPPDIPTPERLWGRYLTRYGA